MSDRRYVNGVWYGQWMSSDRFVEPNSFIAALEERSSLVAGTITERDVYGIERAQIEGVRAGGRIEFGKHYDGSGRLGHSVAYAGTINAASTSIVGTWRLGGGYTGGFTMTRQTFDADELADIEEAETRVSVKLDEPLSGFPVRGVH